MISMAPRFNDGFDQNFDTSILHNNNDEKLLTNRHKK